jgi:hypothetical protein
MWTDPFGNPVTLDDAAAAAPLRDFLEGFLASEARAANILSAADDGSPLVQACIAALHMFAESPGAPAAAAPFIARAAAGRHRVTPREAGFVDAVQAWVAGDLPRAIALHARQAREHPRDLASLKLGQYHLFNRGDAPGMLRMVLDAAPACADVPELHGLLAFAWEQCHALGQAEAAARRAIAMRRKEPWAHHALAHVMLTQGRIREGHAILQEVSDTWVGLNSFMVTHNWWHQALFAIELDQGHEALQLFDTRVWGVAKDYSQDQVNAVSLLARLELAGVPVGERWQDVAGHLTGRTNDHVLPFLDLHYLLGLARAGRPEADALMQNLEHRASGEGAAADGPWRGACLPAARGVLAWARGSFDAAARHLGDAGPRLLAVGGSHAQRDLFAQLHLDALVRSGRLAAAQNLLLPHARQQPESVRLRRQAAELHRALGLGDVAGDFR